MGINMLTVLLKPITQFVTQKLEQIIPLLGEQKGLRRNRSCTDLVYIVRQSIVI